MVANRRIYRNTGANKAEYFLVAALNDNTTTSYLDTKDDALLGTAPQTHVDNKTAGAMLVNASVALRIQSSETAVGIGSMPAFAGTFNNAAFGASAGNHNRSVYNTFLGDNCGTSIISGYENTLVGRTAAGGATTCGSLYLTGMGYNALYKIQSGNGNTAFGCLALQYVSNGSYNIGLGYDAGGTGSNQSVADSYSGFIGYNATRSVASSTALSNAWAIGRAALVGASNALAIGCATYPISVGLGGVPAPARMLEVLDSTNPQIRLTQAAGTVYTDLKTDASGNYSVTPTGDRESVKCINISYASAPGTPANGDMYFNTSSKHFYGYIDGVWKQLDN
jgi:hypothetical protein